MAKIIDTLLLGAVLGVVVDGPRLWVPQLDVFAEAGSGIRSLFMAGVVAVYYTLLEAGARQASLGKRLLRLRVTALGGERPGPVTALMRSWPHWLPILFLGTPLLGLLTLVCIGALIAAAFTTRKQGLHDLLAKTLVVRA